jgi:hypothetical protein
MTLAAGLHAANGIAHGVQPSQKSIARAHTHPAA